MAVITLRNSFLSFSLSTKGARFLSLEDKEGFHILQCCDEKSAINNADCCAGFPLLPIANRVKGNSYDLNGETIYLPKTSPDKKEYLHGQGWMQTWSVKEQSSDFIILNYSQKEDIAGYAFSAELKIYLQGKKLIASLILSPLNKKPRLYGVGFHPYFFVDKNTLLQFKADGFYPEGENYLALPFTKEIPEIFNFIERKEIPQKFINHCYTGFDRLCLFHANGKIVGLKTNLSFLMMYHVPNLNFIALEPQSHPVDACHIKDFTGLKLLKKNDMPLTAEMEISLF